MSAQAKRKYAAPRVAYVTLRRFCEASADGAVPTAVRILRAGHNQTDKGDLNFTPRSAKLVMAAYQARGNPLAWYFGHEDRLPLESQGGAPMKGACSAPSSELTIRDSAPGPECWAEQIAWTDEAKRQILSGESRQISPVAAYDPDTREVLEIINVSLVREGATHNGTLLASRSKGQGSMDDLMQQLQEAIESSDWETAESLVQQMEAMDGGAAMAKMARACMAKAKGGAAPPPPPPPAPAAPVAEKRLAAVREVLAMAGVDVATLSRVTADMVTATAEAKAATKRSDRTTVLVSLSRAREEGLTIDGITERRLLNKADPEDAEAYLGDLRRMKKAGVLVASKDVKAPDVNPPKADPSVPGKRTATEQERITIAAFNRGKDAKFHITEEEFFANQDRQNPNPAAKTGARA